MSLEITENAAKRIKTQLAARGSGEGLRLSIKKAGCSGYSYVLDFADKVTPSDTVYERDDAKIVVSSEDLKLLKGVRVDFRREGLNQMYHFENPNAQALCGCGESFFTEDSPEIKKID